MDTSSFTSELALYFMKIDSILCAGAKNLKKENDFHIKFGAREKLRHIYTEPYWPISPLFVLSNKIKQK